jgi:hypothetical protein
VPLRTGPLGVLYAAGKSVFIALIPSRRMRCCTTEPILNVVGDRLITIPQVQPTDMCNRMRPHRAFSGILSPQSARDLKAYIRRFRKRHVTIVGEHVELEIERILFLSLRNCTVLASSPQSPVFFKTARTGQHAFRRSPRSSHPDTATRCYAFPGIGITFSLGATTFPCSKSGAVGVSVRLYHGLLVFFVRSVFGDHTDRQCRNVS